MSTGVGSAAAPRNLNRSLNFGNGPTLVDRLFDEAITFVICNGEHANQITEREKRPAPSHVILDLGHSVLVEVRSDSAHLHQGIAVELHCIQAETSSSADHPAMFAREPFFGLAVLKSVRRAYCEALSTGAPEAEQQIGR